MWPNPQFPVDLVTFTEEILHGKLHFCAVLIQWKIKLNRKAQRCPPEVRKNQKAKFSKLFLVQF